MRILQLLLNGKEQIQKNAGSIGLVQDILNDVWKCYSQYEDEFKELSDNADPLSFDEFKGNPTIEFLETGVRCIGALCELYEQNRHQVFENINGIAMIFSFMSCRILALKLAACKTSVYLSRSVKRIKGSIIEDQLTQPLLQLLNDPIAEIQESITAMVCNILLDLNKLEIEPILASLISLTNSDNQKIRFNAICAIKNLVYKEDIGVKDTVMRLLPLEQLHSFANDDNVQIQEQAACILRNLLYGKAEYVQKVLSQIQGEMFRMISMWLQSPHESLISHALYCIANIASGDNEQKDLILNSEFFQTMLELLNHPLPDIREASSHCFANLTWPTEDTTQDHARLNKLLIAGVKEKFEELLKDDMTDFKTHISKAIDRLNQLN